LFHSKNICPLLFLTSALVSFKKYMPPPLQEIRKRRGHIFFE
jgi:hypothetical protein